MKQDKWVKRWYVARSDGKGDWTIAIDRDGHWGCSCPVWRFRRQECKHIIWVREGEEKKASNF